MSGRRPVCPVGHGPMIQSNEPGGVVWACLTCGRSTGLVDEQPRPRRGESPMEFTGRQLGERRDV